MGIGVTSRAYLPLFTPESKNVRADIKSIRPAHDAVFKTNG